MDAMSIYNKLARPPKEALKKIEGGRLKNMTDIKPQWRIKAMTEAFGLCGIGWTYSIDKVWSEPGGDKDVMCFAIVSVKIKDGDTWSEPFQGIGGSQIVEKESKGLHTNDEGYKMAVTDALSVAFKMVGVAAEIYMGNWDGTKYRDSTPEPTSDWEPNEGLITWGDDLASAEDLPTLKRYYDEACEQYKDIKSRAYIVAAKDKRKNELAK